MATVDVLIIGAGPAGTSCASTLAKRGWSVVVIDKSIFPRHKTCGGFIGPENQLLLSELGVWTELLEKGACVVEQSVLTSSHGASTVMPIEGIALGVSRQLLDKLLLDRVKAVGIDVYEGAQVRSLYNRGKGFEVIIDHYGKNKEVKLSSRHVIDATGQKIPSVKPTSIQYGIAALYEGMPEAKSRVMLHCCQGGHVGINPFENDQVNVCYVVDAKHFKAKGQDAQRILTDWMQENHHLQKVISGAKRISPWKAVQIPVRKSVILHENGIWRVGNAAAMIDTTTGGGISIALLSGRLLAQALTEHANDAARLRIYAQEYRKHFSGQRRLAALFGGLVHRPWVAQSIISFLGTNYKIRRLAMNYARPGVVVERMINRKEDERRFA